MDTLDQLALAIDAAPLDDALLALRDRETKTLLRLASSMRLTLQARYKAEVAATAADKVGGAKSKPWD